MMTIEAIGSDLRLTCEVGRYFSRLSALPGRKRWVDRQLILSPTGANLAFLLAEFPEADWQGEAREVRDRYIQLKQEEENTRQQKDSALTEDPSGYQYKTVPFDHQRHAFLLSRDLPVFALFHEQGCGKTKVILDTAAYLWERGKIDTLIVVAPNGVHRNWIINEVPAHLPDRIPVWMGFYSASLSPKKLKELEEASLRQTDKLRILTFNCEGFTSEKAQRLMNLWLRTSRTLMVVDESSRIKNHSALRTKYLIKAGRLAVYRRIMTGTPVTRGAENLYSQFMFLDSRILGYNSFFTFRARYCVMGGFENRQIVSYRNLDELTRVIDGHSHRVLKKQCLDLPEKIYERRPFEMAAEQRKLYDAVRQRALEDLERLAGERDGHKLAAELAIVQLLRLQQIACGWKPQETPEPLVTPNPRMLALMDALEDVQGKAIIWARFKADLRAILRQLGEEAVGYWGEISSNDRVRAVDRFQRDPRVRWFIGHPQAAGIGLTLTAAETAIYYSNDYNLESRLQSEDRCHRIGTRSNVVYIDIEAIRSIDRRIINSLRKKKALADLITRDPASLFLEES